MTPLSLRARLALMTVLLLGLMALLGFSFLTQLSGVSRALDSVYDNRLVPMQQLRKLAHGIQAELPALLVRLSAGQQTPAATRDALDAQQRELDRLWAAYKATLLVEEELHLIARAEPQLRYLRQALQRLQSQLERDPAPGGAQLGHALDGALGPLATTLDQLIDVQLVVARREADASRAAVERSRWQLLLALLGSGVLAVLLAVWVWSSHRRAQLQAQAGERRVQQFYVALSQCNQLIVRSHESSRQLYEGLCRICVETGQALLAAVIETDGRIARRVAAHGPVERLLDGVPSVWDQDSAYGAISLTAQVMRSGEHLISNEAALDPRMSHWHGSVVARGAQAMAAFPLRRGGAVVGALLIFGGERGYFDPALVRLLDEMAGDLSFALDNLDRERERTQALAAAEAGRELFHRIFNASLVSAAVTALPDGRVLEANELLCRRYGVTREQLIGRRMGELGVGLLEADRERYYALLREQGRVQNLEVRIRNRAGEPLHSLVGGEIIDYQGQRCVLSVSVDITELRRAQAEAEQRAAAEAANRAKTEFLAQMSHELRTPLHAILGLTQLLAADTRVQLPPAQQQWLDHIRQAGWHLLGLINDVLDIAGIEAGRLQLERRAVALRPLLEQALALVAARAAQRQVRLEPLPDGPEVAALHVLADARRLQQVLINLLDNAIKYNRPGGSVRLALGEADGRARLTVSDTGLGMDEAQLAQLFQPFNRLGRERGEQEGSGIGLALSRELLLRMDGSIEAHSRPGEGTRFELGLPLAEAPALPAPAERAGAAAGRVLYIEDNEVNRLIVEQMLAPWPGLRLDCAATGAAGLARAAAEPPPDLVLLDMELPDMSGLDCLARLRADPATAGLRVVALSANALPEDVAAARAAGVLDYWTKPLELQDFLAKMRDLLTLTQPIP